MEVAGHELLFVFVGVKLFVLRGKERGRGEVRIGLSGCRFVGTAALAECRSAPMSSASRAVCDTPTVHFCCPKVCAGDTWRAANQWF